MVSAPNAISINGVVGYCGRGRFGHRTDRWAIHTSYRVREWNSAVDFRSRNDVFVGD
jgi:hypothetical protein